MEKLELREKLLDAFKELRKEKIIARANFMCCQSCASYDIWEAARKSYFKSKKVGYVYWHHQDEEDLKRNGHVLLAFGSFNDAYDRDVTPHMKSPLSCKDVGIKVVLALIKRGIRVEWDGSEEHRILASI